MLAERVLGADLRLKKWRKSAQFSISVLAFTLASGVPHTIAQTTNYEYDELGRLKGVTYETADPNAPAKNQYFVYDCADNRREIVVNGDAPTIAAECKPSVLAWSTAATSGVVPVSGLTILEGATEFADVLNGDAVQPVNELIDALAGADTVQGNGGDDWIFGASGADNLQGGNGIDHIWGNEGNDVLRGDNIDQIDAQTADVFIFNVGDDNDRIYHFEPDYDIINLAGTDIADWAAVSAVMITSGGMHAYIPYADGSIKIIGKLPGELSQSNFDFTPIGGVPATSTDGGGAVSLFNVIDGTDQGDALPWNIPPDTSAAIADLIHGYEGVDTINGYGGDDVIFGDEDNDAIFGGSGADWLYGGDGADLVRDGDGDDFVVDGFGADRYYCDAGANLFVFDENGGADRMFDFTDPPCAGSKIKLPDSVGTTPAEILAKVTTYGSTTDAMIPITADNVNYVRFVGVTPSEILAEMFSFDAVPPSPDSATLVVRTDVDGDPVDPDNPMWGQDDRNDHMRGYGGNDRLYGGTGHDYLEGGDGDDILHSAGAVESAMDVDIMDGGDGIDRLYGYAGLDTFVVKDHLDKIYDFNSSMDIINLYGVSPTFCDGGVTSRLTQSGGNVLIELNQDGSQYIIIYSATVAEFTNSNFECRDPNQINVYEFSDKTGFRD